MSRGAVKALPLVADRLFVLKTTLKTRPRELQKPLQRKNDACDELVLVIDVQNEEILPLVLGLDA